MDIVFVTTELAPFVKVGGLADVSAALPKALRALGHAVTIVLPRTPALEEHGLLLARRLTPLKFTLGDRAFEATVLDGRLSSQVDLAVVDLPGLFDKGGVYDGEETLEGGLRFAAFSRAAAEIVRQRVASGRPVDAVHCNEWTTALTPTFLRALAGDSPALAKVRSVLTLHNVAHQGVFPREALGPLGLGDEHFHVDSAEFYGRVNLLKLGIVTADAVTTVSPTYAREIQTSEHGMRLDGVLRARGDRLVGVCNGVDYAVWNPATDPALAGRYDAEDFTAKTRCKAALQRELGLPIDTNAPLVVSVGRMVPQKGTDLVAGLIPRLLRATEAQVVVAGDGEASLVAAVSEAATRSDGRAKFVRAASELLVHRLFAGADLTLVPSRFEPCGLVQMYGQRYGAPPVARATGGLIDTVVDCDAKLETGTGFLFDDATVEGLFAATERALAARATHGWNGLVRRVMRLDRTWDRAARRYEGVYKSVTA